MFTKRKITLSLILVLTLTLVLGSFSTVAVAQDKEEIVWAGWSGEEESSAPSIEWMMSSWEEKQDKAEVKWQGWPWSEAQRQMILRIKGGNAPDLAQLDVSWLSAFTELGALADLNNVFDEEYLQDKYVDSMLKAGRMNGKQVALPWTLASIGMIANPVILEKAGISQLPTTIDQFKKACEKIKEYDSDIIPYAAMTKRGATLKDFQAWLWTFGGRIFDDEGNVVINSDATINALEWYKEMLEKGYIETGMSRFDARELFANEKVGFYDDAILAKGILRSKSGMGKDFDKYMTPMLRPVLEYGDKPQSMLWGHMLVMFKQSDKKEVTADFMDYVTSTEVGLQYFENLGLPPVTEEAQTAKALTSDPWAKSWSQITKYGSPNEFWPYPDYAQLNTIFGEEVQSVLVGKKSPEKAAEAMEKRIKSQIEG